jgi:6-pyruvoyl-tetrahydropterin synthase related domain
MAPRRQLWPTDRVEAVLNNATTYLLASAVILSVAITVPRLTVGIPMGVDTTSHLYKILFLQYWWRQGVNPFWSADWYAGSPALLLYPPLSYYLTAGFAMLGIGPLLAYKLVDAFFYSIAPVAIFFLGRELGFGRGESALGALIFSVFPEVIENYLFFDRFPTVLAIPIFCAFLIFFHRSLVRRKPGLDILLSMLSMSALLLIHHLSALIAGIVAVLMILLASGAHGVLKPLLKLIVVAVGTLGITAFWLMPFLESYNLFSANGFYNRNVTFPFLRFTYFGFDVTSYLVGIAQFILAAIAIQSIVGRNFNAHIPLRPAAFFAPLLAGMAIFQAGEIIPLQALDYLGELIVALSFTVFFGQFIVTRSARKIISKKDGTIFASFWFLLFLWLGLGFYALPVLQLPVVDALWTKTMDVYRLWLYLALPMSVLAARGLFRSAAKLLSWRPISIVLLLALAITPVTIGVAFKVHYDLTSPVNGVLPYSTANTQIPPAIISYFTNDNSQGRILGVNVPLWIYLLPMYVNKPIVDGWYPQTKLVVPLVSINDYRLDDLETAPTQSVRFHEWRGLIDQGQLLDITWVIIGDNGTLAAALMAGTDFTRELTVPYEGVQLMVYKSRQSSSLIDGEVNVTDISSPNPDQIKITIQPTQAATAILVKEAYFPTWRATANGHPLTVTQDKNTGYILLILPSGTQQVMLYQDVNQIAWGALSLIALITVLALTVIIGMRGRRGRA